MRAVGIGALALCVTISTTAAASYTSYFYTTDDVSTGEIMCDEEVSQSSSVNSCLVKCAKQLCYRCRWNNGMCHIRKRNVSRTAGKHAFRYKKVSFTCKPTSKVNFCQKKFQKKYLVVKENKNFADSSAHCESLGESLALPESVEENEQILRELSKIPILLLLLTAAS